MTRDQARDEAKQRIEEYLRIKGINPRKEFNCLNPAHPDKHPSMSLDKKHNRVKCFSCNVSYDVFDLIGIDYNLPGKKDQFNKAYELFGIKVDGLEDATKSRQNQDKTGQYTHTDTHTHTHEYTQYYETCKKRIGDTEYHRGLSAGILARHWVGYDPEFKTKDQETGEYTTWRALIIPTGKESYTARNTAPEASKKNRYRNRGAAQIFNFQILQASKSPVFVVEGEIDAMSIEEAGGAAIGLGSLDNIALFLRMLEAKKPSQPLIIALDNEEDQAVQKIVQDRETELTEGLKKLNISHYTYRPFDGYHDANEALIKDRDGFIEAVKSAENIEKQAEDAEREAYLHTSAGACLQEFIDGITAAIDTPCISTGFKHLDKILDGGLYEGLITIGAISSLGKTSLVLQIADQVAEAGEDVLIFSLEMARAELMSKSISRHTLRICLDQGRDTHIAKAARGITDGKRYINYTQDEQRLIQDAIKAYSKYAGRIYIQEGVGDIGVNQIRETIEKHIHFTGRRPLVIVDYLQILAPYSDRATDKQNTDKAVLELKRISRDFKLPLIAISSFNRNAYKTEAMFEALKESGAIEYTSDIVVGLQLKGAGEKTFNATQEKNKNPRNVELVILKNRQYKVGGKVLFDYYPAFNFFDDKGMEE